MSSAPASRSQDQPQGTVWLCLLLVLPICVSATITSPSTNPGIRAWLNQRTLEFGESVLLSRQGWERPVGDDAQSAKDGE